MTHDRTPREAAPPREGVTEELLGRIRPAVRKERPYRVGGPSRTEIKLNQNESPFDLPAELKRSILDRFLEIPWNRYPSEQPEALREALAERLGLEPEAILVGNGSNELTYTFGLTMIGPGTPVVLPYPMFSLYEKVVRLSDGRVVGVGPRPDFRFDAEAIAEAARGTDAALVVLTAPNNPTGCDMTLDEIEHVLEAAPGFVVVDEAYLEFTDRPSALTLLDRYPGLIVLRTFSKAFGLAGLRLGYILGRPEVMRELLKSRIPFVVDRLAETVGLTLLEHEDLVRERVALLRDEREQMERALGALEGVHVIPSGTNFVTFRTPLPAQVVIGRMQAAGIALRDVGSYPTLEGYMRVNAGSPAENRAFLVALEETIRAHRG